MNNMNTTNVRIFRGCITRIEKDGGFIDEGIYFPTSTCQNVQMKIGETVIVNAVETPNAPFKWTAQEVKPMNKIDQSPYAKYTDPTASKPKVSRDAALDMYSKAAEYNLVRDNHGDSTELWVYGTVIESVYIPKATHSVHLPNKSAREIFYEMKVKLQECYVNSCEGGNSNGRYFVKPIIIVECGLYDIIYNLDIANMDERLADLIICSQQFLHDVHLFVHDVIYSAIYSPWMECLTRDRPTDAQCVVEMATIFLNAVTILRTKQFGCGVVQLSYPLKTGARSNKTVKSVFCRLASDGINPSNDTAGVFARNIKKALESRSLLHNGIGYGISEISNEEARERIFNNYNKFITAVRYYTDNNSVDCKDHPIEYEHHKSAEEHLMSTEEGVEGAAATIQNNVPETNQSQFFTSSQQSQATVNTSLSPQCGTNNMVEAEDSGEATTCNVPEMIVPRTVIAARRMCKDTPKEWKRDMKRLLSAFTLRERQIESMREQEDEKRLGDFKRRANLIIRQPVAHDPNDFSVDLIPGDMPTVSKRSGFDADDEFVCPATKRYAAAPILQQPVQSNELLTEAALQPPKPPSQMLPPPRRREMRPLLSTPLERLPMNRFDHPMNFGPDFRPKHPILPPRMPGCGPRFGSESSFQSLSYH